MMLKLFLHSPKQVVMKIAPQKKVFFNKVKDALNLKDAMRLLRHGVSWRLTYILKKSDINNSMVRYKNDKFPMMVHFLQVSKTAKCVPIQGKELEDPLTVKCDTPVTAFMGRSYRCGCSCLWTSYPFGPQERDQRSVWFKCAMSDDIDVVSVEHPENSMHWP